MDVDEFKVINDSLGHEAGDRLLVTIAGRLKRCLRPEDTLVRFGGDEFAVLVDELKSPKEAVRVAERIIEGLREPFVLEGRELFTTASIGIALGDARAKDPEVLLREADTAMYRAKKEYLGYRVFDESMYQEVVGRLEMENDLKRGVESQEFVVHYQPIVNLQTGKTWEIEALVRWQHPERGLLDPSEFIPTAEESGLVILLGEWVLKEACSQAVKWQKEHPRIPPFVTAVNLSTA